MHYIYQPSRSCMIYLYTDGSSTGGRGVGGYGWIVVVDDVVVHAGYGSALATTNNLMELEAAIQGLKYLNTYFAYVLGIANGTYTASKNLDETKSLRELTIKTKAITQWVRGHSGDTYNELADSLAKMGKREAK